MLLKDYYSAEYAQWLAGRIAGAYPEFHREGFAAFAARQLEGRRLFGGARQPSIVNRWQAEGPTKETREIILRGTRTVRRRERASAGR